LKSGVFKATSATIVFSKTTMAVRIIRYNDISQMPDFSATYGKEKIPTPIMLPASTETG
jgi:hypothetical protein